MRKLFQKKLLLFRLDNQKTIRVRRYPIRVVKAQNMVIRTLCALTIF